MINLRRIINRVRVLRAWKHLNTIIHLHLVLNKVSDRLNTGLLLRLPMTMVVRARVGDANRRLTATKRIMRVLRGVLHDKNDVPIRQKNHSHATNLPNTTNSILSNIGPWVRGLRTVTNGVNHIFRLHMITAHSCRHAVTNNMNITGAYRDVISRRSRDLHVLRNIEGLGLPRTITHLHNNRRATHSIHRLRNMGH